MIPTRFFFRSSTIIMVVLLLLFPFISSSFLPLWAIMFWGVGWIMGSSWIDLRTEQHEREADTKVPSDNGAEPSAEPFGKRDTSVYLIDKGRTNRW